MGKLVLQKPGINVFIILSKIYEAITMRSLVDKAFVSPTEVVRCSKSPHRDKTSLGKTC